MEQGVLDVVKLKYWSFIPRRGSGRRRRGERSIPAWRPRAIAKGREGRRALRGRADRAVRRDPARGDRGDAGRRRRAAGRAGRGAGDLRRQPQHQLHQRLHRRLRLLRLRPGQALARRLPGRARRTSRRGSTRRSSSAPPRSACRAGSIPTTRSRTTGAGCGWPRRSRREIHLHAYSPMEIHYMCERSGKRARGGLRVPARVRARLDPGHRRRGARRRRAPADLAEQAAGRALGRDHRGLAPRPACARPRP